MCIRDRCWALEPTRSGRTRIRNVLADKYIDLVGMNTSNGAQAQIHHLAGKAVADAPAALACIHELPLLPRMSCIAPQLDGRAVLGVEVLYFQ